MSGGRHLQPECVGGAECECGINPRDKWTSFGEIQWIAYGKLIDFIGSF